MCRVHEDMDMDMDYEQQYRSVIDSGQAKVSPPIYNCAIGTIFPCLYNCIICIQIHVHILNVHFTHIPSSVHARLWLT